MKEEERERLQRLKILSELMDSRFEGPYGIRFGLDGILGLIPFAGDIFTTLVSFYILVAAAQMGATPSTLIRMSLNVLFDDLISKFPLLGNIADFWWKSNNRNMKILEAQLSHPEKVKVSSRIIILLLISMVLVCLFVMTYLSWMIIQFFVHLLS